jgi:hypothetical protein
MNRNHPPHRRYIRDIGAARAAHQRPAAEGAVSGWGTHEPEHTRPSYHGRHALSVCGYVNLALVAVWIVISADDPPAPAAPPHTRKSNFCTQSYVVRTGDERGCSRLAQRRPSDFTKKQMLPASSVLMRSRSRPCGPFHSVRVRACEARPGRLKVVLAVCPATPAALAGERFKSQHANDHPHEAQKNIGQMSDNPEHCRKITLLSVGQISGLCAFRHKRPAGLGALGIRRISCADDWAMQAMWDGAQKAGRFLTRTDSRIRLGLRLIKRQHRVVFVIGRLHMPSRTWSRTRECQKS